MNAMNDNYFQYFNEDLEELSEKRKQSNKKRQDKHRKKIHLHFNEY